MSAVDRPPPGATGPALEVSGLRVELESRPVEVVADIDMRLDPGQVLGVVGESGSGKTTVALALLGYARSGTVITRGSVVVGGVDLLAVSRSRLRSQRGNVISYVPQDPGSALNPALRVGTQLSETLEAHDVVGDRASRESRISKLMADVSLPTEKDFLHRYPHQLSGGQQQRVAIAMAFACGPAVVVLDEPTTGLDVTTQAQVLQMVRTLCEQSRTAAVYVSHDLAVVAGLAHRVAVMYSGRVVEIGSTAALMHAAAHPYTRGLLRATPDPKARRAPKGIPGRAPSLLARPDGCVFATRCAFVQSACRTGVIRPQDVAQDHRVACIRWETIVAQPPTPHGRLLVRELREAGEPPAIEICNLTAGYGAIEVLHDVSLSVARGTCTALVGESGSGKTTLARCLGGLHAQASGELRLGGAELPFGARRRDPERRRSVQYIFQNPYTSLNPRKTVGQLIQDPLIVFGQEERRNLTMRTAVLLDQVELNPVLADRYPAQLSGGERQRVAIARALAANPEVLICDEVTSSLDVSVQASILALLALLHVETGLTILFITHNIAVVRAIADRVAVLNNGRIVEDAEAADVLDHPRHPYTQELLNNTPTIT